MRIATLTWARNEEDILEFFLRHTASFADTIHIVLHQCTDASKDIAMRMKGEGLDIRITEDRGVAHRQAQAITELLEELRLDPPDWIIPLDADEFLSSSQDIRTSVQELPPDMASAIPWKTYVPTENDDSSEKNPVLRIRHRRSREEAQYRKIIIPGALLAHADLRILPGSHALAFGSEIQQSIPTEALWLAHFPVRSETQLRRKILQGWQSVLANPNKIPGEEFHWEQLYNRCLDPRPIDTAELSHIARDYAQASGTQSTLVCDPLHTTLPVA